MSLGLGGRLSLAFAALVAVTALSVGAGSSLATDRQVSAELDRSLTQRAAEIADGRRSPPEPRQAVTEPPAPADAPDVSVQLLSGDGEVTSTVGVELPVEGADLEEAATGGAPTVRTVTADGAQLRMVTMHLPGGGAVQVATSLDDSADLLGVLRSRITVIALGMATFAGVLGWLLAQRITRPLRSLTDAVDAVAETQDLSVDVPTGRDEIGRLGRGFDRCLGAMERSRQVQTRMMQDAAHELRTPLTSISANIDWLRRADDLDPAQRASALDSVRRELDGLNTAVGEIVELAFDGSAQGDLGRVDVAEVVTSAVEEFAERTGRRVTIEVEPTPVLGDAPALTRAVRNLLSNADKYSPPELPIDVLLRDGRVWVSDGGPGIPIEDRGRVGDRFYRLARDRGAPGSGLGLAIVSSVAELHGGALEVTEAPGGGARVGFGVDGAR